MQIKKNDQLSNETMYPPPYAPTSTETRETGLYLVLPTVSEKSQPPLICPILKGHLQVEGWMQVKNVPKTEEETKWIEEIRLQIMHRKQEGRKKR